MINLKKIVLNNFGVYLGKHELDFPENGLYSIVGKYENEPSRSNGAGKTFLVRAVAYCLDFAELPSASLQNYNTEEPFSVTLVLELDGSQTEIYRDKNNYIVSHEEKIYRSVAAREFIKSNILDSPLISFVTYKQQDERGNFLPLKPAEKVEFLSNLLKLDKYQTLVDNSLEKLKKIESDIVQLSSEEDIVRVEIFSNKEKIDLLDESVVSLIQQKTNKEKAIFSLKEPILQDFVDSEKYNSLLLKKQTIQTTSLNSIKTKELFALKDSIESQLSEFNIEEKNFEKIKQELILKIEENKTFKNSLDLLNEKKKWIIQNIEKMEGEEITCPECNHIFSPHHTNFKEEVSKLVLERNDVNNSIIELEKQINKHQKFIGKYKNIGSIDKLLKQRELLVVAVDRELEIFNLTKDKQLDQLIYELKFFNENNQKLFESAKQRHLIELQNIHIDIENIESNISNINVKIQALKNKEAFLNEKNNIIKDNLKKNRKERDYLNELINCIGKENFIRLITEETLSLITEKVNTFLSEIPNTEKITVRLSIDKETKKGTLKKNINLQVFASGIERPYEEFSGGEKCSINLATDTAISEIIAERTGKRFGWFIIDEGQGGMDGVTKLESLQILNKLSKNKLILVIDHSNEINEYLDGQIIVLKTPEGSSIVTSHKNSPNN